MYDLHTHSYFSDGVLGPSELARRCQVMGYKGLVISDHCDSSNIAFTVPGIVEFCRESKGCFGDLEIIAGCELTHVPPKQIGDLARKARKYGAGIVLVHGETLVEPVAPGTNKAALKADIDVLAHPGLITEDEVKIAAQNGVRLEITVRKGHSLSNGHVAKLAVKNHSPMSFGSDGHAPGDYPGLQHAMDVLIGAGLDKAQAEKVMESTRKIFDRRQ